MKIVVKKVVSIFPEIFEAAEEIKKRKIHGATGVTIIALKALANAIINSKVRSLSELYDEVLNSGKILVKARPTTMLLANGIRFALYKIKEAEEERMKMEEAKKKVYEEILQFRERIKTSIEKIAEITSRRIRDGDIIFTHGFSTTVFKVIERAAKDKNIEVIVTETRPEFQGRIMANKLNQINVPTTLIVDSAARFFMKDVDKVILGAEAIAANGAVINKIGSSLIALAAHEARVRVFVTAGTYKFSQETMLGELIEIEERDPTLVAPKEFIKEFQNLSIRNPAFDVTPPEYIDLIITENGVIPPQGVIYMLKEIYGWPTFEIKLLE